MADRPFVPRDFEVPVVLETERMRLRMLSLTDAVKDYEAVMSSEEHLLKTKPFGPKQQWPAGLTLEQNMIDLGWHQKEFQLRSTFAYTVMTPDESQCLGCIYIDPSSDLRYDASVILWVRQSETDTGLEQHLFETVREWIDRDWPFERVAYPGRDEPMTE